MKKIILSIILSILLINPMYAFTYNDNVVLPSTTQITPTKEDANRLNIEFIKSLVTNEDIKLTLKEMSKDLNADITVFKNEKGITLWNNTSPELKDIIKKVTNNQKLPEGYYFAIKFKSTGKVGIIKLVLDTAELATAQFNYLGIVGNIIIPFLKDKVFKVSDIKQLEIFNKYQSQIVQKMTSIYCNELIKYIQHNPANYGIGNEATVIIIQNSDIKVIHGKNIHVTGDNVEIVN